MYKVTSASSSLAKIKKMKGTTHTHSVKRQESIRDQGTSEYFFAAAINRKAQVATRRLQPAPPSTNGLLKSGVKIALQPKHSMLYQLERYSFRH